MTRYTYDTITGIYIGTTTDNLPNSTELVPYLQNANNTTRFVDGAWTEITIAEKEALEEFFNPRPIAYLKMEKKSVIQQTELHKINSGITYNSHKIDSDDKAQKFITSLMTAVNAGIITELEGFTTFDGVDITLTSNDIVNISGLLLLHVATCHAWKRGKYALVDAATTREELEAIVVND